MRIVHEVHGPMSASAGTDNGGVTAHVFACNDARANHPELPDYLFSDDEVIEIEGDPKYLRAMLETWLKCLDSCERKVVEQKNLGVAQPV